MSIAGVCQKKGQTYRRFRVKAGETVLPDGKKRTIYKDLYVKLPDPSDPAFAAELARVNKKSTVAPAFAKGTIGALAAEFRVALGAGWTKKKRKKGAKPISASTMENYLRYVDMIVVEHGSQLVARLTTANVYTLRDRMAAKPGKANNWLNVLKLMMHFAQERGWINANPASPVGLLPIGEHDPWPRHVLEEALATASPMLRLAIVSGLCSGQRVSDVIQIQHNWLRSGIMEMSQLKTRVDVAVPVHPWWRQEIDKVEKRAITILYDRAGKPFKSEDRIQDRIRRLMRELGYVATNDAGHPIDKDGEIVTEEAGNSPAVLYTFHGLRKNACCYLLEAGLPDTDVGLILGMSPDTVRHYGKRAKAFMVARRAAGIIASGNIAKLGR